MVGVGMMMMFSRRDWLASGAALGAMTLAGCSQAAPQKFEFALSDGEWKKRLSPAAYETLRHAGTERPYSSALNKEKRKGTFACAGCALPLFVSVTKYDSGTGWPSFWDPMPNAIVTKTDWEIGSPRTEVLCRRCGGHLGHVFDDGPKPTGKRYCMNGVAMTFKAT
jgi:peptide-methionine (R)-S-oxide reductase